MRLEQYTLTSGCNTSQKMAELIGGIDKTEETTASILAYNTCAILRVEEPILKKYKNLNDVISRRMIRDRDITLQETIPWNLLRITKHITELIQCLFEERIPRTFAALYLQT